MLVTTLKAYPFETFKDVVKRYRQERWLMSNQFLQTKRVKYKTYLTDTRSIWFA
jgi:hypothetical protein